MADNHIILAKSHLDASKERLTEVIRNNGGCLYLSDVMDDLLMVFGELSCARANVDMAIENLSE
ncbi:MAG: hypothetical protein IKZ08_02570 [Bacteroidales bacterium]|nr:hypothetical protein [Bacteroidales bacterium]